MPKELVVSFAHQGFDYTASTRRDGTCWVKVMDLEYPGVWVKKGPLCEMPAYVQAEVARRLRAIAWAKA